MSHFYGSIKGTRGEATRCGDKRSGYKATIAGWGGAIQIHLTHRIRVGVIGVDRFDVRLIQWGGSKGEDILLASGVLSTDYVSEGGIIRLHPELVRRYTEAEAFRIMKGEEDE